MGEFIIDIRKVCPALKKLGDREKSGPSLAYQLVIPCNPGTLDCEDSVTCQVGLAAQIASNPIDLATEAGFRKQGEWYPDIMEKAYYKDSQEQLRATMKSAEMSTLPDPFIEYEEAMDAFDKDSVAKVLADLDTSRDPYNLKGRSRFPVQVSCKGCPLLPKGFNKRVMTSILENNPEPPILISDRRKS